MFASVVTCVRDFGEKSCTQAGQLERLSAVLWLQSLYVFSGFCKPTPR